MSVEMIQEKLLAYQCQTSDEQENALKEIAQEIALMILARAGFFREAAFQGGTCLRILYGLERFSEDLDFVLIRPDKQFDWSIYLQSMSEEFSNYGYSLEVINKNKVDKAVRIAFLKADSMGGVLILRDITTQRKKLLIKLEIDTNPPAGSQFDLKYLDFPMPFSVKTQDLSSLFAGKMHALLCRNYTKGRDWYDFIWYVSRQTPINFVLLSAALEQVGPWQGEKNLAEPVWVAEQLKIKIQKIDWESAKKDVAIFLRKKNLIGLEPWSEAFFISRVEKLVKYL